MGAQAQTPIGTINTPHTAKIIYAASPCAAHERLNRSACLGQGNPPQAHGQTHKSGWHGATNPCQDADGLSPSISHGVVGSRQRGWSPSGEHTDSKGLFAVALFPFQIDSALTTRLLFVS